RWIYSNHLWNRETESFYYAGIKTFDVQTGEINEVVELPPLPYPIFDLSPDKSKIAILDKVGKRIFTLNLANGTTSEVYSEDYSYCDAGGSNVLMCDLRDRINWLDANNLLLTRAVYDHGTTMDKIVKLSLSGVVTQLTPNDGDNSDAVLDVYEGKILGAHGNLPNINNKRYFVEEGGTKTYFDLGEDVRSTSLSRQYDGVVLWVGGNSGQWGTHHHNYHTGEGFRLSEIGIAPDDFKGVFPHPQGERGLVVGGDSTFDHYGAYTFSTQGGGESFMSFRDLPAGAFPGGNIYKVCDLE
ncbi:MAG: hypothetical protein ABIH82_00985, partial [Candidatus Woesearchaeota archaeon]